MDILFFLIPVSVVLVFAIGFAFWWSVRSGQFDDMEGPAHRILMDDDSPEPRSSGRLVHSLQVDASDAAGDKDGARLRGKHNEA